MRQAEALELTALLRDPRTDYMDWVWLADRAYKGRAWAAMGHPSWDIYCSGELHDGWDLRQLGPVLTGEQRCQVVFNLSQCGMPTSAVAALLNMRPGAVINDRRLWWRSMLADSAPLREQSNSERVRECLERTADAVGTALDSPADAEAW